MEILKSTFLSKFDLVLICQVLISQQLASIGISCMMSHPAGSSPSLDHTILNIHTTTKQTTPKCLPCLFSLNECFKIVTAEVFPCLTKEVMAVYLNTNHSI